MRKQIVEGAERKGFSSESETDTDTSDDEYDDADDAPLSPHPALERTSSQTFPDNERSVEETEKEEEVVQPTNSVDEKDESSPSKKPKIKVESVTNPEPFFVKNLDTGQVSSINNLLNDQKYTLIPPTVRTPSKKKGKHRRTLSGWLFGGKEKKKANFIEVHAKKKDKHYPVSFTHLHRIERIQAHSGVIWTMKFNRSGKYLATGSQDGHVNIYEIDRFNRERIVKRVKDEKKNTKHDAVTPYRNYLEGKCGDVLDICWSKRNFILTSTMDKTVRVWHIAKDFCLAEFTHGDLVSAVCFHPTQDEIFVTASFDEMIRVWNLREKQQICFVNTKKMLTSIVFSKFSVIFAGTYDGKCVVYDLFSASDSRNSHLKMKTTIDVRSRRGKNKGKKVTGIELSPHSNEVMISTNDSRIRVYSLNNYAETQKYIGYQNKNGQIRATYCDFYRMKPKEETSKVLFGSTKNDKENSVENNIKNFVEGKGGESEDNTNNQDHNDVLEKLQAKYIISGSENDGVFLWNSEYIRSKKKRKLNSYEWFSDSKTTVTCAIFAPFLLFDKYIVVATANYQGQLSIYMNEVHVNDLCDQEASGKKKKR